MIPFFRKVRKQHADDNQFMKYSRYAIGEIVLVVIGILIALQINNWNEDLKTQKREHIYLENIKADLLLNIDELNEFIESRESCIRSCDRLLDYYNQKIRLDLNDFNYHSVNVMVWFPFKQHDNTYQELLNSGNLAIISDKVIRNGLQNMQVGYKNIAFVEGEMQQDYESYLYDPYFSTTDLESSLKSYEAHVSANMIREKVEISREDIETLLKNKKFKNGIVLSKYNSNLLVTEYRQMIASIEEIIEQIDKETSA
jgi:predicted RND superfamily exporter protein